MEMNNKIKKASFFLGRLALAVGLALVAYFIFYRPLQLNWGASKNEIERRMVGDEIVARPKFNATRAVTVAAPPERIWPWLVQIGLKRAGWYSHDLLDNFARPSARRIIPELQNLKDGDLIPMSPDGKMGFRVKELQAPRWMLWWDGRGGLSWAWELLPLDAGHTRFITRIRLTYKWLSPYTPFYFVLDVGDMIMMRQCMLGIRDRAEGRPVKSLFALSMELLAWILAFAGFVVAAVRIVTRRSWFRSLLVALLAAALTILMVIWQQSVWLDFFFVLLIWIAVCWTSRSKTTAAG